MHLRDKKRASIQEEIEEVLKSCKRFKVDESKLWFLTCISQDYCEEEEKQYGIVGNLNLYLDEEVLANYEQGIEHFWETMINFLMHDKSIHTLSIVYELSRKQQLDVVALLEVNTSIKALDLGNSFTEFKALTEVLTERRTLERLSFFHDNFKRARVIDEEEMKLMVEMLKYNDSIKSLYMTNCRMCAESSRSLSQILASGRNSTLSQLSLSCDRLFDEEVRREIERALKENCKNAQRRQMVIKTILLIRAVKGERERNVLSKIPKRLLLYIVHFLKNTRGVPNTSNSGER